MPRLIRQLLSLFNRRERWQVAFLLVAMVIQAFAELVGVASIVPFMSVVADPEIVHRNETLRWLYETFGFTTDVGFLTFLGVSVIAVMAFSNAVSATTLWATYRFTWGMQHRLSLRMLKGYLAQPYGFFVQRNTARLNQNILSEVQAATSGVMQPFMTLLARSLITLAIVGMLVAVDPVLAILVTVVLGGAYGAIYMLVRRKQARLGLARVRSNEARFKVTAEAFGGIKDVKVLQREEAFVKRYVPASLHFSRATATNVAISAIPKYLLETVAFGGILLMVVFYLQAGEGLGKILPTLSLYAIAGYRLMPALQLLFSAASSIRFQRAALDNLVEDMAFFSEDGQRRAEGLEGSPAVPLEREIRFENVTFRYPGADRAALDSVSLSIPRNQTVGLVGASGSGKTTLVDILLGLYEPEVGRVLVDDNPLTDETLGAWRRQVGYVPQHIFLCDDTIAHNIAFGVPPGEVDHEGVERAARIAHLHDFIQSLPDGYDTVAGERGVRLSGGQRQRIGIARALYHDPEVLVMDEATSALDGATEGAVMEAINDLAGKKTIILIAHRLTTVEDCDQIYLLENGRVAAAGTFEELQHQSMSFRAMAKLEPAVPASA